MKRRDMDAGESRRIAPRLREITEAICNATGQPEALGFIGGDYGYGAHFENDTFSMMPFYWGDCTCGHTDMVTEWLGNNPHGDDCYQTELERRGYLNYEDWDDFDPTRPAHDDDLVYTLAAEWGLPRRGCAVHCTCGRDDRLHKWERDNIHTLECPEVRPNFHYKPTGTMVWWYKYIGRGMDWNGVGLPRGWENVCIESVEDAR